MRDLGMSICVVGNREVVVEEDVRLVEKASGARLFNTFASTGMPIRCNSESNLLEAVAEERAINKMTHRSQDDTQSYGAVCVLSTRVDRNRENTQNQRQPSDTPAFLVTREPCDAICRGSHTGRLRRRQVCFGAR
ncbi:hypothetical protein HPB52_018976 [Rhipicephalus sanguineus]|uniref:Uncharacterized protein n=1 Tax=Rhipicephalus sanguineus TaxID=34632 RepID=A0A9D4Q213_RHISA|nr:hypothetical protein HPB52_018976 [Rhipicephalus sanguineus]